MTELKNCLRAFNDPHPGVPGDAVLVVHHVVAGLEIVEEPGGVALAGTGSAVRAPPAGEVGLGEDGELRTREDAAPLERAHLDGQVQPLVAVLTPEGSQVRAALVLAHGPNLASA